jgi:hypothetical protein
MRKHPHLHGYGFAHEQQPQGRKRLFVKAATETSHFVCRIVFASRQRSDGNHRMRCTPEKLRTGIYGAEYVRGNGEAAQMQSIPQNCTGTIYPPALTGGGIFTFPDTFQALSGACFFVP